MESKNFFREWLKMFEIENEALAGKLSGYFEYRKIKKGTVVVQAGEIETEILILCSGGFQGSYCDENGKIFADCLPCEFGEPVIGTSYFGKPSPVTMKAVLNSEVFAIPISSALELIENHKELQQIYLALLLKTIEKHREAKLMLQEPKLNERYKWFAERYRGISDIIPNKTIASFIGVSEEWFCKQNPKKIKNQTKL